MCLVGAVLLLAADSSSTVDQPAGPTFETIVASALQSESTSPNLVRRLQYAQAALVRGNLEFSRQKFVEIRDDALFYSWPIVSVCLAAVIVLLLRFQNTEWEMRTRVLNDGLSNRNWVDA